MLAYIIRRSILGIPTLLGVLFILFCLFFWIASPESIARRSLGEKATVTAVQEWIVKKGYNLPKFYNADVEGKECFQQTRFYNFFSKMLKFDFGESDYDGEKVSTKIKAGLVPSLMLSFPVFWGSLLVSVFIAMIVAIFRETYVDKLALLLCVTGMSIVYFLYIIGAQFFLGKILKWFPVSGWSENHPIYFLTLPVIVGIIASLAVNVRFYRTVMVNEVNNDYIRTARAKGLGEGGILFGHLLKNAMIPIITNVALSIRYLFMGSLLMESFFGIPGIGYLTVQSIQNNDFPAISAIVFISAVMFVIVNILADISYTLVDPRVKLS